MTSLGHPQIDADLYQAQKVLNLGEDLHTLITAIAGTDNYDHTLPVSYWVETLAAERRRQFDAGYTLAVANLIHLHDQPGMAADVMAQTSITITDVNRMGLTDYDLKPLRKMFREESSLRRSHAHDQP